MVGTLLMRPLVQKPPAQPALLSVPYAPRPQEKPGGCRERDRRWERREQDQQVGFHRADVNLRRRYPTRGPRGGGTMRIAAASPMSGTAVGRRNAAISRLAK